MILLRTLAAVAGVGILAAVAHVTIAVTGGYGWNTNAPLTIALAVGVALGTPVASLSRPTLAVLLCLSLLAGEAYGFLATASWHVANIATQRRATRRPRRGSRRPRARTRSNGRSTCRRLTPAKP
jgi:hypothetical protein